MNIVEMQKIVERGMELRYYMRDYYSLEHDGIYGEEFQFTDDEIMDGINAYLSRDDEEVKRFFEYGAETYDRETVRDIILTQRGEL